MLWLWQALMGSWFGVVFVCICMVFVMDLQLKYLTFTLHVICCHVHSLQPRQQAFTETVNLLHGRENRQNDQRLMYLNHRMLKLIFVTSSIAVSVMVLCCLHLDWCNTTVCCLPGGSSSSSRASDGSKCRRQHSIGGWLYMMHVHCYLYHRGGL